MQVALAWLLRRSPNVLLIPGTSSMKHLHENLAAVDLVLPDDAVSVSVSENRAIVTTKVGPDTSSAKSTRAICSLGLASRATANR